MSRKKTQHKRIYFVSLNDNGPVYRADCKRDSKGNESVLLSHRMDDGWVEDMRLEDTGNGLLLQGSTTPLALNYGDAGDIRMLLDAHQMAHWNVFGNYWTRKVSVRPKKRRGNK